MGAAAGASGAEIRTAMVFGTAVATACAGAPITTDCASASVKAAITAAKTNAGRHGRARETRVSETRSALDGMPRATLLPRTARSVHGAPKTPRPGRSTGVKVNPHGTPSQ
ncbi:hypothetical protein GCM10028798_16150 [Humibacter antri]